MSTYTKTTNFTAKDNLTSGDPAKVIKGSEFDTEFNAIETAVNSKADKNNGVHTGTTTISTANIDTLQIDSVTVTATSAELNTLDGITSTTAELNKLDGYTGDVTDLNKLASVTATATEINVLDGSTATTADLNKLAGVTATSTELNLLDGVTATTAELNHVDGVTSNIQTQLDNKQPLDAQLTDIAGLTPADGTFIVGNGTNFVAESGNTAIASLGITATATELNTLDGITATTTELNYTDGVTSNIQTQLNSKASATASPTLTLNGDVSGSATMTNLGNATLTVTVADDSHNHTIANVDGLQTALDGKATTAQGALADSAVQPNDNVSFGTGSFSGEISANGGIALGDNDKATFGAGDDLQIYHSGSHSIVADTGAGDLLLRGNNARLQNSDGSQTFIHGFNNAGVSVFYNTNVKLATTATGVDVTGTVSADGLTVGDANRVEVGENDINIYNSNYYLGSISTNDADNTNGLTLENDFNGKIMFKTRYGFTSSVDGSGVPRMLINPDGDIHFYEDTGTTAKMVWDASAESLTVDGNVNVTTVGSRLRFETTGGDYSNYITTANDYNMELYCGRGGTSKATLGTNDIKFEVSGTERMRIDSSGRVGIGTSPSKNLHVYDSSVNFPLLVESGDETAGIEFKDNSTTQSPSVGANGNSLVLSTAFTERARLDSSGEFLVGTTSYPSGTVFGTRLNQEGAIECSRDGNISALFNRSNSDGEIVRLQKDGSTVGSIGAQGGALSIGTGDTGLYFGDVANRIQPWDISANASQDATIDLGTSSNRFKDLYLSGGVITSSDYRLKEDIQPMQSYADTVKQMNLVNFAWKESGEREDGFIAHELQALVPNAVRGNKDAVNEDGEAQYQGVDPLKLIPVLTKALQEALERIEALEAKL